MSGIRSNGKGIVSFIYQLATKIDRLTDRVNALSGKKAEMFAMIVYAVAHFVMAIFHEPWFDEAVAWQIARCASIRDILFEIPHYEGHPPLWHLILIPFVKLGAPYELSLSLVSFLFAGTAVYLIIFKSPFPRIIRLLLPFTYFFFYQYGVISRPYCVMMLAFMLLAMNYHSRNDKPGHYTLCLMLLCLTSAYGIVFAGGLAIVWVCEIWGLRNIFSFLKTFKKDKRIWWLISLAVLAFLLIAEIMPYGDTFATNLLSDNKNKNGFITRLVYMLFCLIPDVSFTSLYTRYNLLQLVHFDLFSLISVSLAGIIIWIVLLSFGRKKQTILTLIIPYFLFASFSALVYLYPHHIGIGLLFIIFWIWISVDSEISEAEICIIQTDISLFRNSILLFSAFVLSVSLYWNISSCVKDVFTVYAIGREEATFIKEYGLDQYNIMVGWDTHYNVDKNEMVMDINSCRGADNVAPYFEHNLFFNFNDGSDLHNYSTHITPTDEYTSKMISSWKENCPDILFMSPRLSAVYGDECTFDDYTLVYSQKNGLIWKGISFPGTSTIHVRNDLLDEVNLVEYVIPTS